MSILFYNGSMILLCFQANKLDCYSFIDADRKHKISCSEAKGFITHGTSSTKSISIFALVSLMPESHLVTEMDPDGSLLVQ